MQVKCFVAIAASFFLSVTGCHLGGVGASGCGLGGSNSLGAGCNCGSCSGLVGRLPGAGCSACGGSACTGGCVPGNTLTPDGFGTGGGYVGPLARLFGRNHRGAQSPTGAYPGPPTGAYAGPPAGVYAGSPTGVYTGPPAGVYAGSPTGVYTGSPTGAYTGPPTGAYTGPPTGPATGTATYPYYCSACGSSACTGGCVSGNTLTPDGFRTGSGYVGPLARLFGRNHRGAQSHTGAYPGPAAGPPTGTVTYPYYTTRGPRDFFLDDPPSIGR